MATHSLGQHNDGPDLDFLAHGRELLGQVVGALVRFGWCQAPVKGVGDAVDLDFVGSAHAVENGDLEHFCAFVGESGRDCGRWVGGLGSLSWNYVQRSADLNLQKIAATRATRVQRCTDVVLRYPITSNTTQHLYTRCCDVARDRTFSCRKKRIQDLRRWPTFDPQISTRWRVRRVQ